MSKRKFFKEGNRLYTPFEVKAMNMNTKKYNIKKVFRSVDEITTTEEYGRYDMPREEYEGFFIPPCITISTKQLRNRKVAKQMAYLSLIQCLNISSSGQ